MYNKVGFLFLFVFLSFGVLAQQATIQGVVKNNLGEPVDYCNISVEGTQRGATATMNGEFRIKLNSGSIVLVFKHVGHKPKLVSVTVNPGEVLKLQVVMETNTQLSQQVEINSKVEKRDEVSLIQLDPKNVKFLPSPFGDFNKILATLPGVVSNNELTSQYGVRGGGYDENLVYVNDMEIYRPFLVSAGQQEGLSFINPDLVKNVEFSSGGWQPRFGDKLSSVLNIEYKQPTKWGGSISAGILTQAAHIEGVNKNKRISFVAGVRRKTSAYLFNNTFLTKGLEVTGEYRPSFTDAQANVTFNIGKLNDTINFKKTTLNLLFSFAANDYLVRPASRESDFGTITKKYRIYIGFDGQERLNYNTWQGGLKLSHKFNKSAQSDIIISGVSTLERERVDVEGGYNICDVQTDRTKSNFNECTFSRGVGTIYNYARNNLQATIINLLSRNYFKLNPNNRFEYGAGFSVESINDNIYSYSFLDSTDYTKITSFIEKNNIIQVQKFSAYAQHSTEINARSSLTYGVRVQYGSLNKQLLVSPRIQYSYRPDWKRDVAFRASWGYYQQPPFYREMRDSLGNVNRNLKAQTSMHFIVGSDIKFTMWRRTFKFTSEGYYKNLWNVVAYDVDNVRLRYYANNNTVAYATGADFRVSGEFIKGAESWFSLGLLQTKEDLGFDNQGFIRRPTDQAVTFNVFFQDHLPNNPSARVYLNTSFGSGLPFGPPRNLDNRAALSGPIYRRVDIGFSKVLTMGDKSQKLGRYFDTIWLGVDILNIMGVANTISYTWIKDFGNNQFAVPNTLSTRFLNVRVIANFGS